MKKSNDLDSMNPEDLEKQLARRPLRPVPAEWRAGILAAAKTSARAEGSPRPFPVNAMLTLWRELVLPCRGIWTGVAAAWLVVVALHVSTGAPPKMAAGQMAASGPGVLMVLREQKQILAQLLDPATPPQVSAPAVSHPAVPRPRGELRPAIRSA